MAAASVWPSRLAISSAGPNSNTRTGRRHSLRADQNPQAAASAASGQAATRGISLCSTENGARIASRISAPVDQREGRHSRRQDADVLDQRVEGGIGGSLWAEEHAQASVVFGVPEVPIGRRAGRGK